MQNSGSNSIVIVLGMFDTGLYTIRTLQRNGICVYGYDYDSTKVGYKSNKPIKILGEHSSWQKDLLEFMNELGSSHSKLVCIPSSDEYLDFLQSKMELLPQNVMCVNPSLDLIKMILDKKEQLKYAKKLGFNVPVFYETNSKKFEYLIDQIKYPFFIKPVKIHEWKKTFKNKGFKILSKTDAKEIIPELSRHSHEILIQEIVPGEITNNYEASFYYDSKGVCRQKFIVQKVRQWPMEFGSATATRTITNQVVEKYSRDLLDAMNWRGFANVEFKYDPRINDYQFIEINARVWQQVGHAEALGINFPMLQYLDCTEQLISDELSYPEDSYWIDASSDYLAVLKTIMRDPKAFSSIIKSYFKANDFGLLKIDDLKPFLSSLGMIK